jgi:hypothetical protein
MEDTVRSMTMSASGSKDLHHADESQPSMVQSIWASLQKLTSSRCDNNNKKHKKEKKEEEKDASSA